MLIAISIIVGSALSVQFAVSQPPRRQPQLSPSSSPSFFIDRNGQYVFQSRGVTYVSPIEAVASFNKSFGDPLNGKIRFAQANFPGQATVVQYQLELLEQWQSRSDCQVEILFSGDFDFDQCPRAIRFVHLHTFTMSPGDGMYRFVEKRRDISVNNESEGVIGRSIRVSCADRFVACTPIGRSADEIYVDYRPSYDQRQPAMLIVRDPLMNKQREEFNR